MDILEVWSYKTVVVSVSTPFYSPDVEATHGSTLPSAYGRTEGWFLPARMPQVRPDAHRTGFF